MNTGHLPTTNKRSKAAKVRAMSKKKICFMTTVSVTMDAFVGISARHLAANNYAVTLICHMDDGFKKRNENYAQCINLNMKRGFAFFQLLPNILKAYRIFKKNNFDVIQYSTPNASLIGAIAAKMAGIPIRVYWQYGLRYNTFVGAKRKLLMILEKLTCRLSTDIREVSFMNRDQAIEDRICSKDKIKVLGKGGTIGINLDEYKLESKELFRNQIRNQYSIPSEALVFGFIGRLNREKGINELIKAFKNGFASKKNYYLLMIGPDDGGIDNELKEFLTNSSQIVCTGFVKSEEIPHFISSIDILVHPTYREGFGKVLQEAMAYQVPIITTNIPGASEVIEKNISGLTVPPRDVIHLQSAMEELCQDKRRMIEMGMEGRQRVEKFFDRKRMLEQILNDYNNLTDKGCAQC